MPTPLLSNIALHIRFSGRELVILLSLPVPPPIPMPIPSSILTQKDLRRDIVASTINPTSSPSLLTELQVNFRPATPLCAN